MIMRFCALELAIWKRFIQILGFLDFPHEKISITAATNVANIWQIRVQKADEEKIRMAKFNVYPQLGILKHFQFSIAKLCFDVSLFKGTLVEEKQDLKGRNITTS